MTNPMMILILAAAVSVIDKAPPPQLDVEPCLNSVGQKPFDDRTCLKVLAAPNPEDLEIARTHAALAAGYAQNNRLNVADQHLEQALRLAMNDWHTLANTSLVHLYRERFEQAYLGLSQAMAANPDFPPYLLLNRSLALRGLGRFSESAQDVFDYRVLMGLDRRPCDINSLGCRSDEGVEPRPVQ